MRRDRDLGPRLAQRLHHPSTGVHHAIWSSGCLSDDSALVEAADSAFASRAAAQAIDPAQVSIAEVAWRAAVTRVETVSPALNTVGMLLLIGPMDRGGAAVEIEAVDPQTGRQPPRSDAAPSTRH